MHLRDATSYFGRVIILIPLILIFLTAADSAFACPGHKTKVAYRTSAYNTRTSMPTTVISYRAPMSYRRCGDNLYDTRGARYVSTRSNVYRSGSGTRFVAVRNDDRYAKLRRTRYVAVRNVDYDDSPRYVAVRRSPAYVDNSVRYVAVRNVPRVRYVAVRNIDIDDDDSPRYVAVRQRPAVRYVAVDRDDDDYDVRPVKYVAVRNANTGCARAVALRSCLDNVETTSVRHVVLRNDNVSTGTRAVAIDDDDEDVSMLRDVNEEEISSGRNDDTSVVIDDRDDDTSMIREETDDDDAVAIVPASSTRYVVHRDAKYLDDSSEIPVAVSTGRVAYVTDDDDVEDQAFLDEDNATYVAVNDSRDACMSSRLVVSNGLAHLPIQYSDENAFMQHGSTYISTENASPDSHYVPVAVSDGHVTYVASDDLDTETVAYVPADEVVTENVSYVPVEDVEMDTQSVSYVPVEEVEDVSAKNVSYVPVEAIDDVESETVSYVPVSNVDTAETVSYVPVSNVDEAETTYIAADECPMMVSSVEAEPHYVVDDSTSIVEVGDGNLVAELSSTQQIAGRYGYRDGFEDGRDAALEGDLYHPENSGDYEKATEGYEDTYGDKDVYRESYRGSYLDGYRAGFESANGSA